MRSTTSLTFGVAGQTLELRAQQGRPTAVTFAAYRDVTLDGGTAEFSGTATIDTVNTTVSQASGDGQTDPQQVFLSSTAGILTRRKYLLSEASKAEWVEPIEIQPTYIRVRQQLANAYTTAATFVGTTMIASVDDTWAATPGKLSYLQDTNPDYRCRWVYTVAGVQYVTYSFFDLVRERVLHDVDLDDVNARVPGLADSLPKEYRPTNGRELIDSAWRMVRARLLAAGLQPDVMRDDEGLDEMVILGALKILADGGWRPPAMDLQTFVQTASKNFEDFFQINYAASLRRAVTVEISGTVINGMRVASFDDERAFLPYWRK